MQQRVVHIFDKARRPGQRHLRSKEVFIACLVLASILTIWGEVQAVTLPTPTRSTTIALTTDDQKLVVVNRDANSVTILRVRNTNGEDRDQKLAEIPVGLEPSCVALSPDNTEAYVTNRVSGTVSVISLTTNRVVETIPVGTEPRGCAVTPNGTRLFVANHTNGNVSVIDTATRRVVNRVATGGNPTAVAITNDGDNEDTDERVFVSDFFAKPIPGQRSEANDVGKQGIVWSFLVNDLTNITRTTLSPLPSGFQANRSQFCPQSFVPPAPGVPLHSTLFCPDVNAPAGSAVITADPQGVFPNQLYSLLIRGNSLYVPNIGAQPEPPLKFNVNVQALMHLVRVSTQTEILDRHTNLNVQVAAEPAPANPTQSLARLFGNDIVAMDASNQAAPFFLIVSRGGNYVFRAVNDVDGIMTIQRRYRTGNTPNGVVISADRQRAYTNNEVNLSVTVLDLTSGGDILELDLSSATPPEPGTFAHRVAVGKLGFHTALGIPDDGLAGIPIRDIVPLRFRGKASDNAWSGCASCHPDGLSDNVTWIFNNGPRQTIPMDAFFAKDNPADQRISNWSAVRSGVADFNQNTRDIQGGCGFASAALAGEDPPNPCTNDNALTPVDPKVYNHGRSQGVSDAQDLITLWVQTVRAPILPAVGTNAQRTAGAAVFAANCASCHGGAKWTKSQVIYAANPAFDANPLVNPPGVPRDPGVNNAGAQIVSYEVGADTIQFLEPVGTFQATNPLEIQNTGNTALGGLGFNVPALLGLRYHAPYFHDGSARNLNQVFERHKLGTGTIASVLNATQETNLKAFLLSIDGTTDQFESDTDIFLDGIDIP